MRKNGSRVFFYMLLINACMCYVIGGSESRNELNTSEISYHLSHINHFPKHPQHNRTATVDKCLQQILNPQGCILSWSKILLEHQSLSIGAGIRLSLCSIEDVYRMLVVWLFLNVHCWQCLTWPTDLFLSTGVNAICGSSLLCWKIESLIVLAQ